MRIFIRTAAVILFLTGAIYAQEKAAGGEKIERFYYYTYIGPVVSAGYNMMTQEQWKDSSGLVTESPSALSFSGGAAISVFSEIMSGEITLQTAYYTGDISTVHLYITAAGKYYFKINPAVSLYPGLGFYFETPPSTGGYEPGAGFYLPLGVMFSISDMTRLYVEAFTRYGWYGDQSDSSKLSFGGNAAIIFRVGSI